MNGNIIINSKIAVDYWKPTKENLVHFLSHMHSDHIQGLSSSWRRPIYCSEVTRFLLLEKFAIPSALVHGLALGQAHIIQMQHSSSITVTLIDANHCPGAVMYFFEGNFGNILYTGDFKFAARMIDDGLLHNCKGVDVLYLDNTYNDPRCIFPSLTACEEMIFEIIETHQGDSDIVFGLYNLGKEDLLVKIAKKYQCWITVDSERMKLLRALELPNVFTCERGDNHFLVVNRQYLTWKKMNEWQKKKKTIAIIPTAYTPDRMHVFKHPLVYSIPYTSHSSYDELEEFVKYISPCRVMPIVSKQGSAISDVSNFDPFLSSRDSQVLSVSSEEQHEGWLETYCEYPTIPLKVHQKKRVRRRRCKGQSARRVKVSKGVVFEDCVGIDSSCKTSTDSLSNDETFEDQGNPNVENSSLGAVHSGYMSPNVDQNIRACDNQLVSPCNSSQFEGTSNDVDTSKRCNKSESRQKDLKSSFSSSTIFLENSTDVLTGARKPSVTSNRVRILCCAAFENYLKRNSAKESVT